MIYCCDSNVIRASNLKKLLNKYSYVLLGDYKSADILLVCSVENYKNQAFFHNKNHCLYKDIIFYDCKEALKVIRNADQLNLQTFKLSDEAKCINVKLDEDAFLKECIAKNSEQTYYDKYIMPLIRCAKNKQDKRSIIQSILADLRSVLLKNNDNLCILKHKEIIQEKKLNAFIEWLKTDEAKEISIALLNSGNGNYASFELKYLILMGEESDAAKR